ncbi:MAG: DUF4412 domain-containing protein [Bacteroidetes bacterium]|nr:DUF4412 domain-containing protein [Bacteroidota bacterium]
MNKVITFFGLLLFISIKLNAQQRTVAECTVNYTISTDSANSSMKGSTKTVYIKGNDVRIDVTSTAFNQTTFYDKASGNAVVLREIGSNKIMTKLSKTQWIEKNNKFENATVDIVGDTKIILGYECKKATIKAKDNSSMTVFYATAIVPSVKEFEYQFKDVPGFVLEYEIVEAGKNIKYTKSKINLSPVSSSKFDVPTSGYRLLN